MNCLYIYIVLYIVYCVLHDDVRTNRRSLELKSPAPFNWNFILIYSDSEADNEVYLYVRFANSYVVVIRWNYMTKKHVNFIIHLETCAYKPICLDKG